MGEEKFSPRMEIEWTCRGSYDGPTTKNNG
ncbi:uncharacterized protein G2W53_001072 [Senna tora]|uniref:Uncharacterized protein n=1 Tax=Senna tora TaxID=362788 RepID=A0A834XFH8_9FABA|nr:uncharacterized protein G2W53_001072 [Senna tora]